MLCALIIAFFSTVAAASSPADNSDKDEGLTRAACAPLQNKTKQKQKNKQNKTKQNKMIKKIDHITFSLDFHTVFSTVFALNHY